nr:Niemann Pick C1 protein [Hymenolepis microstoma]
MYNFKFQHCSSVMIKCGLIFVIFFTIIASIDAGCVMQGVCGHQRDHVCQNSFAEYFKATKDVNKFCRKFAIGSNVCCTEDQVKMLKAGMRDAQKWFGGKCYELMRDMFCHVHCSPDQDNLVSDVITERGKVTSFTVTVKESDVNKLFNACKKKTFFFIRLVDKVCLRTPCDAKEFIRSLGTCKSRGGRSPFQINFKFV